MNFKAIVVDDDEICLLVHKQIISISGFHPEPRSFSSGEQALVFLQDLPPDADPVMLFLDINMPVMNGWELLDILHQESFKTPIAVVMVSSSVNRNDKEKASTYSKVIDFIEKPFTLNAMIDLKKKLSGIAV